MLQSRKSGNNELNSVLNMFLICSSVRSARFSSAAQMLSSREDKSTTLTVEIFSTWSRRKSVRACNRRISKGESCGQRATNGFFQSSLQLDGHQRIHAHFK